MLTQCNAAQLEFQGLGSRRVVAGFDAPRVSSDGGALLLRELDEKLRLSARLAQCFEDRRDARYVEHAVETLVRQRVLGLALGYEDLNDHDELSKDPLLALCAGSPDPQGQARKRIRDRGRALAGKSTLNRLERTPVAPAARERYRKVSVDGAAVEALFVTLFLEAHATPPEEVVLDFDATDDPVHGHQEGRFFHGYYDAYCYLPLYVFSGNHLLVAKLRTADRDAADGSAAELERLVTRLREAWPKVRIVLRADSGFAREALMTACENHEGVYYVLGLAKNARLLQSAGKELVQAQEAFGTTGKAARVFTQFLYRTRTSWSRARRVVAKAEWLEKGANPRFIVTNLPEAYAAPRALYEGVYCARGEMENRIKEQQLDLFADRTSTATLHANQLRLWFASLAYVLVSALRRVGLPGTRLAKATCGTLRLKLLKIGALVKVSVRRVAVSLSRACPCQDVFVEAFHRLQAYPMRT